MKVGRLRSASAGALGKGAMTIGVAAIMAAVAQTSQLQAAEPPQVDPVLQRCIERLEPVAALDFAALERRCPDLRPYLARSGVIARLPAGWDQRGTGWDAMRLLQLGQLLEARRAAAARVVAADAASRRLEWALSSAAAALPSGLGESATRARAGSSPVAPGMPMRVPPAAAAGDSRFSMRPLVGLLVLLLTLGLLTAALWPMFRRRQAQRGRRRPEGAIGRFAAMPTAPGPGTPPAAVSPASAAADAGLPQRDPRPARWWAALAEAWMLQQPGLAARALSARELAARVVSSPRAAVAHSELLAWAALSEQVRFAAQPPPPAALESLLARVGAPSAWLPGDGAMPAESRQ